MLKLKCLINIKTEMTQLIRVTDNIITDIDEIKTIKIVQPKETEENYYIEIGFKDCRTLAEKMTKEEALTIMSNLEKKLTN